MASSDNRSSAYSLNPDNDNIYRGIHMDVPLEEVKKMSKKKLATLTNWELHTVLRDLHLNAFLVDTDRVKAIDQLHLFLHPPKEEKEE